MTDPKVVIVGAGFGGLACARALAGKPVDVLLLDRNNYHLFTPLLYQVASAVLNPSDIAQPVRNIVRGQRNLTFRLGTVTRIDLERREVQTAEGEALPYDYLVVAAGSTTNFFGQEQVERYALGLKDLPEALGLRNRIIHALERAASTDDPVRRRELLTFAVVGGGPTGVEYAGALSELVHLVIPSEYPGLRRDEVEIQLIEALPRLLIAFPEELSEEARNQLERRGVRVRTGVRVEEFAGNEVRLSDGSTLRTESLVWAAGVKASPLTATLGVETGQSGRIAVDGALRIKGRTREFAIGDAASFTRDGDEVPMLAAPAMQQGRAAAVNICHTIEGQRVRRYRYASRGSMATIGRGSAVASLGRLRLTGLSAWAAWLAVHLYYIVGFRNRMEVLTGWAWNYFRRDRPVRIIVDADDQPAHRRD